MGQSVVTDLAVFVERIADLRSRAADAQRDTYTIVLGQLRQCGLVEEATYREAMDRPRIERKAERLMGHSDPTAQVVGLGMRAIIQERERCDYWRDLLADVLGDIDSLRHSPAIDAAREALRDE